VALSDDDGAADQAALSRAEPVLTETMAELYLKQGHMEDGLRVYRGLLAQRPGDARLLARIDQLTGKGQRGRGRGSGQSVRAFLRSVLVQRPGVAASSLEQAFAAATPDSDLPGEATRLADDVISLDAVFGDEGGGGGGGGPAAPPPLGAGGGGTTGGFSFDQFFSGGGEPAGGAGAAAPPAQGPARPSGSTGRPPIEDEAALDQFQAWLKGLKS
jgi:hypothetical protein